MGRGPDSVPFLVSDRKKSQISNFEPFVTSDPRLKQARPFQFQFRFTHFYSRSPLEIPHGFGPTVRYKLEPIAPMAFGT
jgi:hypothetical protein